MSKTDSILLNNGLNMQTSDLSVTNHHIPAYDTNTKALIPRGFEGADLGEILYLHPNEESIGLIEIKT